MMVVIVVVTAVDLVAWTIVLALVVWSRTMVIVMAVMVDTRAILMLLLFVKSTVFMVWAVRLCGSIGTTFSCL